MNNNPIKLSIIYVYYNSYDEIKKSINSITRYNDDLIYEIIIVVNRDDENKVNLLSSFDHVKIFHSGSNIGFGAANNLGFKYSSGNFILILNPDTVIHENSITRVIQELENNEQIGLANCKLLTENETIQKTVIYKKYTPAYLILEYFFINKLPIFKNLVKNYFYSLDEYECDQNPDVISGAFMMFKRDLFTQLNGFDEDFFMYSEDHNISLRANKISQLLYLSDVSVTHSGAHSLGSFPSEKKLSLMVDSTILNIEKIFGRPKSIILQIFLLLNALIMYPASFFIKDEEHNKLLKIRSKVILKRSLRLS